MKDQVQQLVNFNYANYALNTALPIQVLSHNPKRRWAILQLPVTEGDAVQIWFGNTQPFDAGLLLYPGESLILSKTGDLPVHDEVYAIETTVAIVQLRTIEQEDMY